MEGGKKAGREGKKEGRNRGINKRGIEEQKEVEKGRPTNLVEKISRQTNIHSGFSMGTVG